MSSRAREKVLKKTRRKQAQLLKQEPDLDVRFVEFPSQAVFIGNGGTQNGLSHEFLVQLLKGATQNEPDFQLYLPVDKDYSFVYFSSSRDASVAVESLNGVCLQEFCKQTQELYSLLTPCLFHGPPLHLFLSYVDRIPLKLTLQGGVGEESRPPELPTGLILVQEFVLLEEETALISFFSAPPNPQAVEFDCKMPGNFAERGHGSYSSEVGTGNGSKTHESKVMSCDVDRRLMTLTSTQSGRDLSPSCVEGKVTNESHNFMGRESVAIKSQADSIGYHSTVAC